MKITRREVGLAMVLAVLLAAAAAYTNSLSVNRETSFLSASESGNDRVKLVSETIEGELEKGKFEGVISQLEDLTEEKRGFVPSLYMTYRDELWRGEMISKIPQENMSSFVFKTREIIDANGTVISITTSITDVTGTQGEAPYATIGISLRETVGIGAPEPIVQVMSVVPWLVTSLVWIAEGLIIGVPLCFVFLGVVLLVDRGIIPVWKKQLKKQL